MTQFCSEPGCGVLVSSGRCVAHASHARLTQRWYHLARWQRLRIEVLQAEPFCRACRAQGRKVLTVDIDHIRSHEGRADLFWDRRNLQGLCKRCHTMKTRGGE
jgi:5-methylcytosine-specific restriction protein A